MRYTSMRFQLAYRHMASGAACKFGMFPIPPEKRLPYNGYQLNWLLTSRLPSRKPWHMDRRERMHIPDPATAAQASRAQRVPRVRAQATGAMPRTSAQRTGSIARDDIPGTGRIARREASVPEAVASATAPHSGAPQPIGARYLESQQPGTTMAFPEGEPISARSEYHRRIPHITQEPISDEGDYVTLDRYETLEQRSSRVPDNRSADRTGAFRADDRRARRSEPAGSDTWQNAAVAPEPISVRPAAGRKHMGTATSDVEYLPQTAPHGSDLHYGRYLQMPKAGKTIFTANRRVKRRRHAVLALVAAVILIAGIIWFFLLR